MLCAFDGSGNNLCLDWLIVRHVVALHHGGDAIHAIPTKAAHQIVLKREIKLGLTRISLTTRTATELIINTSAFVTLGAYNAQTSCVKYVLTLFLANLICGSLCVCTLLSCCLFRIDTLLTKQIFGQNIRISAKQNIRTTAGHVRCNGNGTFSTRLCNNLCFSLMELCIQNTVRNALLFKKARNTL